MRISDWSSDVCSSDLLRAGALHRAARGAGGGDNCRQYQRGARHLGRGCSDAAAMRRRLYRVSECRGLWVGDELESLPARRFRGICDLKSRSEEHTSELQSLMRISYAVFCLSKKTTYYTHHCTTAHR